MGNFYPLNFVRAIEGGFNMGLLSNSNIEHLTSEMLSEHVDNRLSGDVFMDAEAHLVVCSSCSTRFDTLTETVSMLGSLPSVKSPRQFTLPKIYKRTAPSITFAASAKILAYAAVLFLVVVVGGMLTTSQDSQGEVPLLQSFIISPEMIESDINPEEFIQLNPGGGLVEASDSIETITNRSNSLVWFATFSLITGIITILYLRFLRRSKSY